MYEQLRKAISNQFKNNWTATHMSRVIYGDNRDGLDIQDGPWLRVSFNIIDNGNAEIGTNFQIATGILNVQIFTDSFSGEKDAFELVDAVSGVFQNQNFNGVQCFACFPIKIGQEGQAFQTNARIDFEYQIFS